MKILTSIIALLFGLGGLFAQEKSLVKVSKNGFLKEILGAKYSKTDKIWVLPRSAEYRDAFETDAEGGLFVEVDTIIGRTVGQGKEYWILFTVEGYMFNFCRLESDGKAWVVRDMHYKFHEGSGGEYAPEFFGFESIGKKTFISLKEAWYKKGMINAYWRLFDPLEMEEAGVFQTTAEGERKKNKNEYEEFDTTDIAVQTREKKDIPDIVFTQRVKQKKKGRQEEISVVKVRYQWNDSENTFLRKS